ncbi:MAG: glycosyltransferase family 87 protein [Myxococcota bacterium]
MDALLAAARAIELPWVAALGAFAALAVWHRWPRLPARLRVAWTAGCVAAVAAFAVRAVSIARHRLAVHAEWDFLGFWMHGRAAWLGRDFYDNEAMRALDLPWPPSDGFAAELLVAGSVYPPFTSFLFAPFGAFSFETAYWLWLACNAAAVAAAVALAGRRLLVAHPHGALLAAALVALLPATRLTVEVQQSSGLVLLALVAMAVAPRAAGAGVALALAVVVKPLAALVAIAPLARRQWRVLGAAAAAGAALVVASAVVWGPQRYVAFAATPPSLSLPVIATVQPVSQALASEIGRRLHSLERGRRPEREPLFLAAAAALALATLAGLGSARGLASLPRDAVADGLALGAAAAFALVVYPGTKHHYGVVLALPAFALWRARERLPLRAAPDAIAAFVGLSWGALAWREGTSAWAVFLAWWAVMLAAAWAVRAQPPSEPGEAGASGDS